MELVNCPTGVSAGHIRHNAENEEVDTLYLSTEPRYLRRSAQNVFQLISSTAHKIHCVRYPFLRETGSVDSIRENYIINKK